jgi:hypothetical protein
MREGVKSENEVAVKGVSSKFDRILMNLSKTLFAKNAKIHYYFPVTRFK